MLAATHHLLSKWFLLPHLFSFFHFCLSFSFLSLFSCLSHSPVHHSVFPFPSIISLMQTLSSVDVVNSFLMRQNSPRTGFSLDEADSSVIPSLLSRATKNTINSSALSPPEAWILCPCFPFICSFSSRQLPPAPQLCRTSKFLVTTVGHMPIYPDPSYIVGPHMDQYSSSELSSTEKIHHLWYMPCLS